MNHDVLISKLAFSVEDAARMLGIGRTKIFEEIKHRRLVSFKSGNRTLVSRSALEKYIGERELETSNSLTNSEESHSQQVA